MRNRMSMRSDPREEDEAKDDADLLLELEAALRIDRDALDECLQQQPDLFERVAMRHVLTVSRRDQAKHRLEIVQAEVDETIRMAARDDNQKITEREVATQVLLHKDVEKAHKEYQRLSSFAMQWQALKEAYIQRSYVLKDLVALYLRAYYGDPSAGVESIPDLRNRKYDVDREALAAERKRRRSRVARD